MKRAAVPPQIASIHGANWPFLNIRKRHCILIEPGVTREVRFVNKLFDRHRDLAANVSGIVRKSV